MQACKNTYDKKTNKVANELNKLEIGKKTKQNIIGKRQYSPQETVFEMCKRKEGAVWGWGCSGFHLKKKKKALRKMINIHIK